MQGKGEHAKEDARSYSTVTGPKVHSSQPFWTRPQPPTRNLLSVRLSVCTPAKRDKNKHTATQQEQWAQGKTAAKARARTVAEDSDRVTDEDDGDRLRGCQGARVGLHRGRDRRTREVAVDLRTRETNTQPAHNQRYETRGMDARAKVERARNAFVTRHSHSLTQRSMRSVCFCLLSWYM
jgi:hypothetical protein